MSKLEWGSWLRTIDEAKRAEEKRREERAERSKGVIVLALKKKEKSK
jgi:hypothetical protein